MNISHAIIQRLTYIVQTQFHIFSACKQRMAQDMFGSAYKTKTDVLLLRLGPINFWCNSNLKNDRKTKSLRYAESRSVDKRASPARCFNILLFTHKQLHDRCP